MRIIAVNNTTEYKKKQNINTKSLNIPISSDVTSFKASKISIPTEVISRKSFRELEQIAQSAIKPLGSFIRETEALRQTDLRTGTYPINGYRREVKVNKDADGFNLVYIKDEAMEKENPIKERRAFIRYSSLQGWVSDQWHTIDYKGIKQKSFLYGESSKLPVSLKGLLYRYSKILPNGKRENIVYQYHNMVPIKVTTGGQRPKKILVEKAKSSPRAIDPAWEFIFKFLMRNTDKPI